MSHEQMGGKQYWHLLFLILVFIIFIMQSMSFSFFYHLLNIASYSYWKNLLSLLRNDLMSVHKDFLLGKQGHGPPPSPYPVCPWQQVDPKLSSALVATQPPRDLTQSRAPQLWNLPLKNPLGALPQGMGVARGLASHRSSELCIWFPGWCRRV